MENFDDSLNEPGDVVTELVTIRTASGEIVNVKNFCASFTLFEDIFSNVLMGEALLVDAAGLISSIQFAGAEYLTVSYRTPTFKEKITKSFFITKVSDRFFTAADRQQAVVISFISIEAQLDNNVVISKKFVGKADDVATGIFSSYLTTSRFVDSNKTTPLVTKAAAGSSVSFVVPSWSPLRTINWLAARTFTAATNAPNYMFFESNKKFYFSSIEDLIDEQKKNNTIFAEYIYFPGAGTIQSPTAGKFKYVKPELLKQYSMVRNMKPFTTLDVLKGQDYGYYASNLTVNDLTLKTFETTRFDYHRAHQTFKNLEDTSAGKQTQMFTSLLARNPDTFKTIRTRQYKAHNDLQDPLFEKWTVQRNSLLYELSTLRLEIEVAGRTDIEVGKIINFLYPKSIEKTPEMLSEDALDPYMSGLYLVTAIRHHISLNKHTMYLELAKDSFKKSLI